MNSTVFYFCNVYTITIYNFKIVNKKLDKKELSKNTLSGVESAEKHNGNIRAAISRILEISSTDELTSL